MISKFGEYIRVIRAKENDSLRTCAKKLGIKTSMLSAMEVGRKNIPIQFAKLLTSIYSLNEEEQASLLDSINISNQRVSLEVNLMNEDMIKYSLIFARKIDNPDLELARKLKEVLEND